MNLHLSWPSKLNYEAPAIADAYQQGVVRPHGPISEAPLMVKPKANATILMLARNSDVESAVRSAMRMEDKFNSKFGYPWVFLNEEPFSDEFKRHVTPLPPLTRPAGGILAGCNAIGRFTASQSMLTRLPS